MCIIYRAENYKICFWILRILDVSAAKNYFVCMLIWNNRIINIEAYRISFFLIQKFCKLWYCNFWPKLILQYYNCAQKFYVFSLSLPKGDLDLMHRILWIWILNIEFFVLNIEFCELWYCNFWPKLMLQYYNFVQKFYAFFLSLPKGVLDLMHRILYVWILTKIKFKHAIIVILNLYSSFRILWSNAMSYVNVIPELNG